MCSIFLIKRQY